MHHEIPHMHHEIPPNGTEHPQGTEYVIQGADILMPLLTDSGDLCSLFDDLFICFYDPMNKCHQIVFQTWFFPYSFGAFCFR